MGDLQDFLKANGLSGGDTATQEPTPITSLNTSSGADDFITWSPAEASRIAGLRHPSRSDVQNTPAGSLTTSADRAAFSAMLRERMKPIREASLSDWLDAYSDKPKGEKAVGDPYSPPVGQRAGERQLVGPSPDLDPDAPTVAETWVNAGRGVVRALADTVIATPPKALAVAQAAGIEETTKALVRVQNIGVRPGEPSGRFRRGMPKKPFAERMSPEPKLPEYLDRYWSSDAYPLPFGLKQELFDTRSPELKARIANYEKKALALDEMTPKTAEAEEYKTYQLGKLIEGFNAWALPPHPGLRRDFWFEQLPAGMGSMAGFMAMHAAGGLIGIPGAITTGIGGAALESTSLYAEAKRMGRSEGQALKAAAYGIPIGMTEMVPISNLFNRINKATNGEARTMLRKGFDWVKNAAQSGLEEGSQEYVQGLSSNAVAIHLLKANDRELYDDLREGGEVGILTGIFGHAIATVAAGLTNRRALRGHQQAYYSQYEEADQETIDAGEREVAELQRRQELGESLEQPAAVEEAVPVAEETPEPREETTLQRASRKANERLEKQLEEPEPETPPAPVERKDEPDEEDFRQEMAEQEPAPEAIVRPQAHDRVETPESEIRSEMLPHARQILAATRKKRAERKAAEAKAKLSKGTPRRGIGKAKKEVQAIFDEHKDIIEGEDMAIQKDRPGEEEDYRTGYTFRDDKHGRSDYGEVLAALPEHLSKLKGALAKVRLVKPGDPRWQHADGADVMGRIDAEAMAESISDFASRGVGTQLDRTIEFVLDNPEQFTPEKVFAVKNYVSINEGGGPLDPDVEIPKIIEEVMEQQQAGEPVETGWTEEAPTGLFGQRTYQEIGVLSGDQSGLDFTDDPEAAMEANTRAAEKEDAETGQLSLGAVADELDEPPRTDVPFAFKKLPGEKEERADYVTLPGERRPETPDEISAAYQPQDVMDASKEVEGVPLETLAERLKNWKGWRTFTKAEVHLTKKLDKKGNDAWAAAKNFFRLTKDISQVQADRVSRYLYMITGNLGELQYRLFRDHLVMADMIDGFENQNLPLRGRWENHGIDALKEAFAKNSKIIAAQKVDNVRKALEIREAIVTDIARKLVRLRLLPGVESVERAKTYFHRQVVSYLIAEKGERATASLKGTSGYQRARVTREDIREPLEKGDEHPSDEPLLGMPAEFDYNTEYVQAEFGYMHAAMTDIGMQELFNENIKGQYDILPRLKKQAKDKNWETAVGGPEMVAHIADLRSKKGALIDTLEGGGLDRDERREIKAAIKGINEELKKIDPTYDAVNLIGMGMAKLNQGQEDGDWGDVDEDLMYEIDFAMIRKWAADGNEDQKIGARSVLKGIGMKTKAINDALAERGKKVLSYADFMEEGYEHWTPKEGNAIYKAHTISEQIAEELNKDVLARVEIEQKDLHIVRALGKPRDLVVLPTELIAQLDEVKRESANPVIKISRDMMTRWKQYTLLNPTRFVSYNLRNMTGDMDPVLAGAFGAFSEVPQAVEDLANYYGVLGKGKKVKVPGDVQDYVDQSGLHASITNVEIPKLKEMEWIRPLFADKKTWLNPVENAKRWFEFARKYSEFREGVLRLASYRYYLKKIKAGDLKHYGASKRAYIDGLIEQLGPKAAAATLSRELLGDYGNLSVFNDLMRTNIAPFWSWVAVNGRRYPQMMGNAFLYGRLKAMDNKAATAAYTALAAMGVNGLYGLTQAWNHLVMGDLEDDLDEEGRANPHINLYRDSNGEVVTFRNFGAVADFMEWTGLNSMIGLLPSYMDGHMTGKELLTELAKDPASKLFHMMRPDVKGVFEVGQGVSYFPDPLNPRRVDRGEAAAAVFGLGDEYRAIKGKITGSGERSRAQSFGDYLSRKVVTKRHAGQYALSSVHTYIDRYKVKVGKPVNKGIYAVGLVAPMRRAVHLQDYESFKLARKKYLRSGKTEKSFRRSLTYMNPVERLKDVDERSFEAQLTPTQRYKVKVGKEYAQRMEDTMYQWWWLAAKEEPGGMAASGQERLRAMKKLIGTTSPRAYKTPAARQRAQRRARSRLQNN